MVHDDDAFNSGMCAPAPVLTPEEFETKWAPVRAARFERARLEHARSWRRRANVRTSRFRPTRRTGAGARP
jgi:hypothetical protein